MKIHHIWFDLEGTLAIRTDQFHSQREYDQALESIPQTLQKLRERVPISLFTNLLRSELDSTLARIGLEKSWFTFALMGDDVKERKPALDGFYEMIRKSQLPAEEILYVGDRVNVDLLPAKSLGIQSCLVWGKSDEADYSMESFEELLNLLEND